LRIILDARRAIGHAVPRARKKGSQESATKAGGRREDADERNAGKVARQDDKWEAVDAYFEDTYIGNAGYILTVWETLGANPWVIFQRRT
jgi:hypothetical protein